MNDKQLDEELDKLLVGFRAEIINDALTAVEQTFESSFERHPKLQYNPEHIRNILKRVRRDLSQS